MIHFLASILFAYGQNGGFLKTILTFFQDVVLYGYTLSIVQKNVKSLGLICQKTKDLSFVVRLAPCLVE